MSTSVHEGPLPGTQEAQKTLPCDEPCEKCRSRDIQRLFCAVGNLVSKEKLSAARTPPEWTEEVTLHDIASEEQLRHSRLRGMAWEATRNYRRVRHEMILHQCRICLFSWVGEVADLK